jgi:CheY-like chemotaxis protein
MVTLAFCRCCRSIQPLETYPEGTGIQGWCETCGFPVAAGALSPETPRPGPPTVLCIDDDRLVLSVCYDALTEHGYRVLTAADGPSGLATAKAELPDLILLDVIMAGMNGLEVCRLLRAEPGFTATPIILLTSLNHPEVATEGRQVGATLTMRKPYGPELIASVVDQALGRKARPRRRH